MLLEVTLVSFFLIPYFKTFYADGLKTDQVELNWIEFIYIP
jgi:hypothetical protein